MRKFHSVQYNEDHRYPAAAVAEDEGSRKSTQRKIFDVSKKYLNTDRNNLQTGFRPNTGDEFQTEFETQMTDFINLHANDEALKSEIHPFDAQQINYFDAKHQGNYQNHLIYGEQGNQILTDSNFMHELDGHNFDIDTFRPQSMSKFK